MSLRVWLPLNGNLENKGISNIEVINNGATVDNNGKIGKCYNFGNNKYLKIDNYATEFLTYNEFSLSVWFKCTAQNTSHSGSALISGGSWNQPANLLNLALGNFSSDHYTRLLVSGSGDWARGYSYNFYLNQWYNVVLTSGNDAVRAYVNGELIGDSYAAFKPASLQQTWICIGNGTYSQIFHFYGLMNDVRIYNHCLSQKEVKEIAQGLILHYKLDSTTIETSQNLITTEDCFNNATCYNGATVKYDYGTNTDMYKTTGKFQGRKGTKVYMGTAGLDAYPYVYFNQFSASGTTVQTLSFDYFPTSQSTLIPYSYSGAYDWSYTINGFNGSATNTSTCPALSVNLNQWNHIEITAIRTDTTNTKRGIGYIRIGSTKHMSTETDYWLFANVQIEEKNHATAYMGVDGSRTGYIVDSSGYGNDGTIIGAPTTNTDSERYNISTSFDGIDDGILIENLNISDLINSTITYSFWIKPNGESGARSVYFGSYSGTSWSIEKTAGNLLRLYWNGSPDEVCSGATIVDGIWQHICIVKNGSNDIKVYIDGVQKWASTTAHNTLTFPTTFRIGRDTRSGDNTPYKGEMSDFRIYATALSAEDIVTLYHTSAQVDDLQNIHAFEFKENDNRTSVYQNGIMSAIDEIYESNSILLNTAINGGYTPTKNANNSCTNFGYVDFEDYFLPSQDLSVHIECDVDWTAFTADTGGTFRGVWFQGANYEISSSTFKWAGTNYITAALNSSYSLQNTTLLSTNGSHHYDVITTIPSSWFSTYSRSNVGFRCDYSDGTGTINIKNFKVTPLKYYNAKVGEDFISANNFIEK